MLYTFPTQNKVEKKLCTKKKLHMRVWRRGVAMPPQYIFGRGRAQSTYFYARVYFDIFIRVNLILETNTSISLQI